ncbi:MAG: DUF5615 family PIN-like protein [Fibrobacteres bacterium]|nr:DUF5615 family PIN-like protein [Fibrobacterota bacterium]
MTFFLDENFPKSMEKILSSAGHVVYDVRGTTNEGCSDEIIFKLSLDKKAIFLTTDLDFFHTIPKLYPSHFGIIIVALSHSNSNAIIDKVNWAINHFDKDELSQICLLLTDRKFMIRRQ